MKLGAMLGPIDKDDRRIILNLSHPYGLSVNDQVDKLQFDSRHFILRFPSVDDIVQDILDTDDLLYSKLMWLVPFATYMSTLMTQSNLTYHGRVHFVLSWTHGSAAFQIMSDAIANIDDYVIETKHHCRNWAFP